jgi:1-acyl-sn-glycerol-3-phosphate acyltransferase
MPPLPPPFPALDNRPQPRGGGLRAVALFVFLVPWTMLWGSTCIVFGMLGFVRVCTVALRIWARGILIVAGVRPQVVLRSPLDAGARYIFMANHQSALDIPVLMLACPAHCHVRFMAKESLFKIPFLGWGMGRSGFIPIRRENPRHSAELFKALLESPAGMRFSYIIFPEGTRSADGRLQTLKMGAIGLVSRLRRAVVPVTVVDTCRANPKGACIIRSGAVPVVIHAPIPPVENSDEKTGRKLRNELARRITADIVSALPEDQRPLETQAAAVPVE